MFEIILLFIGLLVSFNGLYELIQIRKCKAVWGTVIEIKNNPKGANTSAKKVIYRYTLDGKELKYESNVNTNEKIGHKEILYIRRKDNKIFQKKASLTQLIIGLIIAVLILTVMYIRKSF